VEHINFEKIYLKSKKYSEIKIYEIAENFNFTIIDNIKDNNLLTISKNLDLSPTWIFKLVNKRYSKELRFMLKWSEFDKNE